MGEVHGATTFSITTLNIEGLYKTLIVMSVIMLDVAFYLLLCCVSFAECRYAECRYDECRGAQEMLGWLKMK